MDLKQSLVVHREELLFTSTYRFLSTRNDTNDLTDSTALSLDEDYDVIFTYRAALLSSIASVFTRTVYQCTVSEAFGGQFKQRAHFKPNLNPGSTEYPDSN